MNAESSTPAAVAEPSPSAEAQAPDQPGALSDVLKELDAFLSKQHSRDATASLDAAIGSMGQLERDNVSSVQLVALAG